MYISTHYTYRDWQRSCAWIGVMAMYIFPTVAYAGSSKPNVKPGLPEISDVLDKFISFRAVYSLRPAPSLNGNSSSGLSKIQAHGRLVIELLGSGCSGFSSRSRIVINRTGSVMPSDVFDFSARSFEGYRGSLYHFETMMRQSTMDIQQESGIAVRANDGDISVDYIPADDDRQQFQLSADHVFPLQHSAKLIQHALAGRSTFSSPLFEGPAIDNRSWQTLAVISKPLREKELSRHLPGNYTQLKSWSVTVSYHPFESTSRSDTPIEFITRARIFENGVSEELVLDYGSFAVAGRLTEFTEIASEEKCTRS